MLRSVALIAIVTFIPRPSFGQDEKPQIAISKETTFVTGPLDAEGRVDFVAAIDDKAREGVTPENNAFVPIARAVGSRIVDAEHRPHFFERLGIDAPPENGGMVTWEEHVAEPFEDRFSKQFDRAAAKPWTDDDCPDVADWLRRNDAALNLVVAGSSRPRLYMPLAGTETVSRRGRWGLPWLREAARLLKARAMRRLAAGDPMGAWSDLLTCHRLARLAGASPLMGQKVIGIALGAVAAHGDAAFAHYAALTADDLRGLREQLDRLGPPPDFTDAIDFGSRLEFLELFQTFSAGDPESRLAEYRFIWSLTEAFNGGGRSRRLLVETTLRRPIDWNEGLRSANRWYDRFADAVRRETLKEQQAAFDDIARGIDAAILDPTTEHAADDLSEAERNARVLVAAFMETHVTSDKHFAETWAQSRQRYELSLAALALAEYRVRQGRYPDRLELLVPDRLPSVPADRFAAGPLRYRTGPEGRTARLYSVGVNGRDDDGKLGLGDDDLSAHLPPDP